MKNGDQPAHPSVEGRYTGLTKREYFAAMAMQGLCHSRDESGDLVAHGYDWIASESVKIADALLTELLKQQAE